ncbi:MAG: hypothetical protein WKG07_20375 [Hymenobacter sp.]
MERGGQLLRQEWLTLRAGEQRRSAATAARPGATGPLHMHTTQVRANRLYRHDATVQVAEKPQPLQLAISTFRDRLQPGQQETWRLDHPPGQRPSQPMPSCWPRSTTRAWTCFGRTASGPLALRAPAIIRHEFEWQAVYSRQQLDSSQCASKQCGR